MKHHGHVYHEIYLHLVWRTKGRIPVLTCEIEKPLKKYLRMKSKEIDIDLLEINGVTDHLHVVVKINPNQSVSDVVKRLKGSSSHYINYEHLPPNSPNSLHWQRGYGVLSFSKKSLPFVLKYVRNQKEHHQNHTVISKLEHMEIVD